MDDTNEEWKIMPYFILASGYWLPDYMKDYEIRLKGYCKLACVTKKHSLVFYTKWKASL